MDDYEIRGGGIVREALPDTLSGVRDRVLLRNYKWEPSNIASERRAERYATAADMRRDLLAALRELGADGLPEEALGSVGVRGI